ncbi:lasso RiPP family leader peptide-containing protein [Streptomyces sp. NPDC001678]
MEQQETYEPPVVEEVGAFAELTRGGREGTYFEGGYAPWYVRPQADSS